MGMATPDPRLIPGHRTVITLSIREMATTVVIRGFDAPTRRPMTRPAPHNAGPRPDKGLRPAVALLSARNECHDGQREGHSRVSDILRQPDGRGGV